ncbi:MAG: twin-arginine translocase subunit TatC [Nannocystaceae bacterium]|nr:twin-arginine translocase subunit TatC [Nannocystaceae bacterium]
MADKTEEEDEDSGSVTPEDDVPMSFFDHLNELRKRLVRSAFGIVIAFIACYIFVAELRTIMLVPFYESWVSVGIEGPAQLQALSALETFLTDLRIAVIAAIFIAGPIVFYQLWMFIAPGLYRSERNLVVPFVATSAVMFLGGGVFCYYFVVPVATDFFLQYSLDTAAGGEAAVSIKPNFTYQSYIQYETRLLLGFGAMFEFPLGVYFLTKAGVITHKTLLHHWKVMTLIFFIAGALLTPPEPVTQVLMAAPMIGLFWASVGVAFIVGKDERERIERLETELAEMDESDESDASDESDD